MPVHREVPSLDPILEEILGDGQHDEVVAVEVLVTVEPMGADQAEGLELADAVLVHARGDGELFLRHVQPGRGRGDLILHRRRRGPVRGALVLFVLQALLDDFERQVLVALHPQDRAQAIDVVVVELAVSGRSPFRVDQPLAFQEPDLGDGDVPELGLEHDENFADRHVATRSHLHSPT